METMATLSIFVIVIILLSSFFILAQQVYKKGSSINELTQNVRVCFDRLSRELRQASYLITDVSATSTEIFFQDGHNTEYISYIKYYLNGNELMRDNIIYYFPPLPADPEEYVYFNSIDEFGGGTSSSTVSSQVVGEYFENLQFTGDSGLITITADMEKSNTSLTFDTKTYIRNW